jgi:GT2 family glycosyltransferase
MSAVRVQLVVFENRFDQIRRTLTGVRATLRHARSQRLITDAHVAIGDCSPLPLYDAPQIASLADLIAGEAALTYRCFDENLGSAGGSNRLAGEGSEPLIWVLNPDAYPSPTCLALLAAALAGHKVAATEARQLPIEHPKGYDPSTGEAHWISGASMLIRRAAFDEVGGFDAQHFPLYCDDVDISWRWRSRGWKVVTVPRATVFHDKRPGPDGRPAASATEHESSALAKLKLARRYCRPDIEARDLAASESSNVPHLQRSAAEFRRLDAEGALPAPMPEAAQIADLDRPYFGPHRFGY